MKMHNLDTYDYDFTQEEPPRRKKQKKSRLAEARHNISINPQTPNQKAYLELLNSKDIIVAHGSAGTGKSFLATAYAMKEITHSTHTRLVLCRPNVPTGRTLGAFPGTIEEKLQPWFAHIVSYCKELIGAGAVQTWMRGEHPKIILEPIETIRGRSYDDSIILVEEAQQLTFEELKAITTRIGQNTQMILTGDPAQRDTKTNALEFFVTLMEKYEVPGFGAVKFTPEDIVRSDIVRELIMVFEAEGV